MSLHDFQGNYDDGQIGNNPTGGLTLVDSTLYGMTPQGGGYGTIFRIDTDGANFRLVHRFGSVAQRDGMAPVRGFLAYDGKALYGITRGHEAYQRGAIFRILPDGSGYRLLHEFNGSSEDGILVHRGGLTLSGSTLYGASQFAGSTRAGVVFRIDTDGNNMKVLYKFLGGADGDDPTGDLTLLDGILYGMTSSGGGMGAGTIFRIGINGGGYQVLHRFLNGADDGARPMGGLTVVDNRLYGMASLGGGKTAGEFDGVIFRVDLDGKNFKVIHRFALCTGGPEGTLVHRGSTLYGATCGADGVVFSISTDGTGYRVLHLFQNNYSPNRLGRLTLVGDYLYGMNNIGGNEGRGLIFVLPIGADGNRASK